MTMVSRLDSEDLGTFEQRMTFSRYFTTSIVHPFDQVSWERRNVTISNEKGEVLFEQKDLEVPSFWSQMAASVVGSKYLHGEIGTPDREGSVRILISRVVDTIVGWGEKNGYFRGSADKRCFGEELTHILLNQYASFNSPVWFNVGVRTKPQCSACFILSVADTMDSLLDLQVTEGKLFKWGSGTGTNLSSVRSSKEKLSGGGRPSGPVSFMRAFDAWAGIIKSGGKTRRAAKMQILNADHPDIVEFITCKIKEEKKAWALIDQGYDGSFAAPGGAYESVAFQNDNLSVRATDEFMRAVEKGSLYSTRAVSDGSVIEELNAREVLKLISEGTYICGDPGIQFDTTINNWHTCPNSGRINASNPCSEYMHVDDSACNLSSINLLKFLREDGSFDVEGFQHTVRIMIAAQDMLIDSSSYPTPKVEKNAKDFRQLGLGYANLGALLMNKGLPYDSDEGRELAAAITSLMTAKAYSASAEIASALGSFNAFKKNKRPMLDVIEQHKNCSTRLIPTANTQEILREANHCWREALENGKRWGYRNSQVSVLAPTGTIAFMMDCDTTGIEPDIALVKYKKLSTGGFLKLVNQSVVQALLLLGYSEEERKDIVGYINEHGTIEGAPNLKEEHLPIFDCAFRPMKGKRSIHHQGHLKMMAAVQPFISGAISKTVNIPHDVTVDEIFDIYFSAWKLGLKAVALYRDGSKRTQPLSTGKDAQVSRTPIRRRLPDERKAITHKFNVGGLEGYLTVGLYEDGAPGEIFLVVAKEGSTLSGIMDAFATAVSLSLQYGVPLSALVRKFTHLRFEPAGFTHNKEIPVAKSIIDYVFRWLSLKFLSAEERLSLGLAGEANPGKDSTTTAKTAPLTGSNGSSNGVGARVTRIGLDDSKNKDHNHMMSLFQNSEDAPPCTSCGSGMMVRQAGCYVCLNCGAQGGCG